MEEGEIEKNIVNINKSALGKLLVALAIIVIVVYFLAGSLKPKNNNLNTAPVPGSTFLTTGDDILLDNTGKPYVILFSTTWCPHCIWIKDTFDSLAEENFSRQINLQHWELDTGDNILTPEIETKVPEDILDIYKKYNPKGSIPTFLFGGKYMRIGNGYESKGNLTAEKEDFKFIIGKLLE
ncbi:MAG: thioredoxin family protein [Nanoarchaeota archaeon]